MKTNKIKKVALICALALTTVGGISVKSFAQGSGTGGSDNRGELDGSTWFLGEDPIYYCIEMDRNFGVSEAAADSAIQTAAKLWKDYVKKKDYDQERIAQNSEHPLGYKVFNLNYIRGKCDGNQDLTFYLGVVNKNILREKKKFNNPTAFPKRTSFEMYKGRGRGYIWVAGAGTVHPKENFPNWSVPTHLSGILAHEIGHVLGASHVDGTIMREDISKYLKYEKYNEKAYLRKLSQVDETVEFFTACCSSWKEKIKGRISMATDGSATFEKFIGRKPVGKVSTSLNRKIVTDGVAWTYEIADEIDTKTFDLKVHYASRFWVASNSFVAIGGYISSDGRSRSGSISREGISGETLTGAILDAAGKSHELVLTHNTGATIIRDIPYEIGPYLLRYYDAENEYYEPLFVEPLF